MRRTAPRAECWVLFQPMLLCSRFPVGVQSVVTLIGRWVALGSAGLAVGGFEAGYNMNPLRVKHRGAHGPDRSSLFD